MQLRTVIAAPVGALVLCGLTAGVFAQGVTPEFALKFRPIQKDVEYDTPKSGDVSRCKVEVVRGEKGSGWAVYGPTGEPLRRFMDTNGDNTVDQWSYYRAGIEVYRDNDTNFNTKVDQSRWLNTGGSRWGIDADEDGKIDRWKFLTAEEASRVAFNSMAAQDAAAMQTVLIDAQDLKSLGIESALSAKLMASVKNVPGQIRTVVGGSKLINAKTQWIRFDGASPGLIPQDAGKASADLQVYENAMAIIDNGGEISLLQIGEMVRVGDVWKLTQVPKPIEGDTTQVQAGGILLEPEPLSGESVAVAPTTTSPEARKLLDRLQKLDENSPKLNAGAAALGQYNKERADILQELVKVSTTSEEQEVWLKQMADGLAASVQTGAYPAGLDRLKQLEASVEKSDSKSSLLPYVRYRRLTAEFSRRAVTTKPEQQEEFQTWWMNSLEAFVKEFPRSDEAGEASFQIASSLEINGKIDDAKTWYGRIRSSWADSIEGKKAAGALRRLDLEGKSFDFSGKTLDGRTLDVASLRGKVVAVVYWASWCKPCVDEIPAMAALLQQYGKNGFALVGVNLDLRPEDAAGVVKSHKITWPQIREDGGLDSPPAVSLGILMPPAIILIDRQGRVVSANATLDVLKEKVPELLRKN